MSSTLACEKNFGERENRLQASLRARDDACGRRGGASHRTSEAACDSAEILISCTFLAFRRIRARGRMIAQQKTRSRPPAALLIEQRRASALSPLTFR
jgi:hypothetical protein